MKTPGLLERHDTVRPERLSDEGLARLLRDLGPETTAILRRRAWDAAWRSALDDVLREERLPVTV